VKINRYHINIDSHLSLTFPSMTQRVRSTSYRYYAWSFENKHAGGGLQQNVLFDVTFEALRVIMSFHEFAST